MKRGCLVAGHQVLDPLGLAFDPISMILQCCNPTDLDMMNLIIFGENARRDLVKLSKLTLYFLDVTFVSDEVRKYSY